METKKTNPQELKLVEQLLWMVGSGEEFNYLTAERARLSSNLQVMKGGKRKW